MQAFRLLTNCNDENENDKFAGIVVKRFNTIISDVEVTFISDSLGTSFFVRHDTNKVIQAVYYAYVVEYLDSLMKAVYEQKRIVEDLRLI